MQKLLATLAVLLFAVCAYCQSAPTPWSGAFYYDIKNRHADAVLITKLRDLTFKGRASGFELDGFAGTTVDKSGKSVLGFDISYTKTLFDQMYVFGGVAISISGGQPVGGGFVGGLGWRF